jgi:peptidoglycan/LPS O-acetylase OafA/YrhL
MESNLKVFLPGLNGLRFFAALLVLIGHVELIKAYMNIEPAYQIFEKMNFGGVGVYFFFVLSGFLITYLLLFEQKSFSDIDVVKFYFRRSLRIFPLYFLMVLIGFFILPLFNFFDLFSFTFTKNFSLNLLMYLLVFPNLAFSIFPPVPHIGQLWSIGVEEQFYLIWPWIVKKFRNLIVTTIFILLLFCLFKFIVLIINLGTINKFYFSVFVKLLAMCKFECLLIGACGAILLTRKNNILKIIFSKYIQIIAYMSVPILSYVFRNDSIFQDAVHILISVPFLIIILNVSSNEKSIFKFESKFLNHLGKLSYGIYVFHMLIIFVCIKLFAGLDFKSHLINLLLYSLCIFSTILVSHFSYVYFENYFLKLKKKFSKIHTTS